MADIYDQASGQIDDSKRAMLAAMAQGGTAGVEALKRANADIAAQQQVAVEAALANAARMYAPPELMNEMRATISAPYQRYQADLTAAQAYGERSNAAMQAANSAYFDQAKAAIPALRTYSQAKASENALDRRLKELQIAEKERALGQGGGAGSVIGMLRDQYGTDANANRALLAEAKNYVQSRGGTWGKKGTTALLAEFDRQLDLPEGYTRALLPRAKSGGQTTAKLTQNQQRNRTLSAIERKHGGDSQTLKAFRYIVTNAKSLADAMEGLDFSYDDGDELFFTPTGKPLNKTLLKTYLRSYYAV